MAHAISDRLVRALKAVDRPGTFWAGGSGPAPLPGLELTGAGPVGLPLNAGQVKELKKHGRQAPYGKGEKTVVDTHVRRVWQLPPDQFTLTNPDWNPYLAGVVQTVQRELGLEQQKLDSHLYDLLLYEPGSFFLPHRDGEKLDRMVATLVIVLPSSFRGGELVVRHEGQEQAFDFGAAEHNPFHTYFAAFYADCEHEVRPLQEGYRLCLIYNLTLAKVKKTLAAPRTADRVDEIAAVLRSWPTEAPHKLAVTLEHQYTEGGLVWDALKGLDRTKARVLNEAAGRAGCVAYLARLTLHESGPAEEEYAPRRGQRYEDEEEDEYEEDEYDADNYEMDEVSESSLTANYWSDAAGHRPAFGEMTVAPGEVVPPESLTKVKPQEDVSGYTGNEGLTLNRWYRHAAIVLWPTAHQFDILCDCGIPSAVSALGEWIDRWQKAGKTKAAALKAQCAEFAGKIVARWGADRFVLPTVRENLLKAVLQIDATELIGPFLAQVVARDPLVELGDAFVTACNEHGWLAFESGLTAVFARTTAETLTRNVRLLDRLCATGPCPKGDRLTVCRALAARTASALESIDRGADDFNWRLREADRAEVLAGLARTLLATEQFDLLSQLVTRALAAAKVYPLSVHAAALEAIGAWVHKHLKTPCAALSQWLGACCVQLEALTASEPVAPTDFRRAARLSCDCTDCRPLKAFLQNPVERVYRYRARQDRRDHVKNNAYGNDLDFETDRKGSPQTLVCTKNTASYQANLKRYYENQKHLAELRSIQAHLPV